MKNFNQMMSAKLWNSLCGLNPFALELDIDAKIKAYAHDEAAVQALTILKDAVKSIEEVLDDKDVDKALRYLDTENDSLNKEEKSYLNSWTE